MNDSGDGPRILPSVPVGSKADEAFRRSLRILRESSTEQETRDALDDVLAGRGDVRSLLRLSEFNAMLDRGAREYEKRISVLTPEQRLAEAAGADKSFFDPPEVK